MKRKENIAKTFQRHIMTATSYMIPFVVAGGVLTAVAVMLTGTGHIPESGILLSVYRIGQAGMRLFIPVLGGYIAYSIAEKPGLAPGFIGAYIAQDLNAGFIGGIAAGFIAGYTVKALKKIKLPRKYQPAAVILFYPLAGSFAAGGAMEFILGEPLAVFMRWMTGVLTGMTGARRVPLGILMGALVGSDMGGALNKVACTFAQTQIDSLPFLMGGVGASTGVPPIGLGIASLLFRGKFTEGERADGKAALLMGAFGITEGAIPFLNADPIRVIISSMAGCAVSCTAAFILGCESHAPWGGLIVLPVVTNRPGYIFAVFLGAMTEACLLGLIRKKKKAPKKIDDFELEFEEL